MDLIPEKESEKQENIKILYDVLCFHKNKDKGKEEDDKQKVEKEQKNKKKKLIKLEPSFWDKINEKAIEKCLEFFNKNHYLSNINENEEKALKILELFYKYKPPEINTELKIVPNQNGKFCKYNELYNEKEIIPKFKDMLKYYFSYDICNCLIHKKLNLNIFKELSINENIIKKIKNSFYKKLDENNYDEEYSRHINKAKQLIHFYPKNEEENKDNLVKQFIQCYKIISGEKIEEEEINTINISLWEKAIKILIIDLLKKIDKDKNLFRTLKRLKINEENEDDVIININKFYYILFYYLREDEEKKIINKFSFIPNEKKEYKLFNFIFCNKDIDNDIINILSYLDKSNEFQETLIYQKINLPISHQQKSLENIATKIDKLIKKRFNQIDELFEMKKKELKIEENF